MKHYTQHEIKRNKERAATAKRSARLAAARQLATHTPDQWGEMQIEFRMLCVRCGKEKPLVKDHIIPIYQGGSDGIDNIQPLCAHCNASKARETINWALVRRIQMSASAAVKRDRIVEDDDLGFM